jgi:DNA-binding response OmpR family regulator
MSARNPDKPMSLESDLRPAARTVLVVDDDPAICNLVCSVLQANGFGVLRAATPQEALAMAETRSVDVLVTDVTLPLMDGLELAARVAGLWPGLGVLVISGASPPDDYVGPAGSRTAFLQKPFRLAELAAAVARLAR